MDAIAFQAQNPISNIVFAWLEDGRCYILGPHGKWGRRDTLDLESLPVGFFHWKASVVLQFEDGSAQVVKFFTQAAGDRPAGWQFLPAPWAALDPVAIDADIKANAAKREEARLEAALAEQDAIKAELERTERELEQKRQRMEAMQAEAADRMAALEEVRENMTDDEREYLHTRQRERWLRDVAQTEAGIERFERQLADAQAILDNLPRGQRMSRDDIQRRDAAEKQHEQARRQLDRLAIHLDRLKGEQPDEAAA